MYPIRLEPAYQHYVWGGKKIPSYFKRDLPENRYAESWEVSDRKEGESKVANGKYKGMGLHELLLQEKESLVGRGNVADKFPLLVKIIDSKENLSVQIHPDEEASLRLKAEPKSECWIALEESIVYAGLKKHVDKELFLEALEKNQVEDLLVKFILKKGEAIFIPAGQVHAIAAGAFLLEVQQNSNTTYRLYDWGRIGRELHLEQGLACAHFHKNEVLSIYPSFTKVDGHLKIECLITTKYFEVDRYTVVDRYTFKGHSKHCRILFFLEGEAVLDNDIIKPGVTYFIPANCPDFSILGSSKFVVITPF